jgi:hypothetical protein
MVSNLAHCGGGQFGPIRRSEGDGVVPTFSMIRYRCREGVASSRGRMPATSSRTFRRPKHEAQEWQAAMEALILVVAPRWLRASVYEAVEPPF